MTDIRGRNAVVTGGGSGIGMALAKALAKDGVAVAVADIILPNAEKVAAEICADGGNAIAVHCDVCERESIESMKQEAQRALGPISLLVANAGATCFERLTDMSNADVDWIIHVNLMGTAQTIQAFLPDMIARGQGGHIVATASTAGLIPGWVPYHAPYSAAKLGTIGMMLNLAIELKEHQIGTTIYCPGGVATGMKDNNERYRPNRFGGPGPGPVRVPKDWISQNLVFLSPEAVAPMVLRGVKNNRRLVIDHSDQRQAWVETYQNLVLEAFDDALEYEKSSATAAS
jgi:NAD(P)-dependent dehydrogenase (short-subunit alcohol dehydrogenase family)